MFIGTPCCTTKAKTHHDEATRLIFPLLEPWLPDTLDNMLKKYQPLPRHWDLLDWPKTLRLALLQATQPHASFEQMLREVWQTWWQAECVQSPPPSTAALAKARQRLPIWPWRELLKQCAGLVKNASPLSAWPDHQLLTIDGTPLSLPNTPANRQYFGVTRHQNGEAYFPQALAVWVARLHPQIIVEEYFGTCHEGDETVAPALLARVLQPNDLILGDSHYGHFPSLHTIEQRHAFYLVRAPGPLHVEKHIVTRATAQDWDLRLECTAYMREKYPGLVLPESLKTRCLTYTVPSKDRHNGVEQAYFLTNLPRERYAHARLAVLPPLRWNHETLNNEVKSRLGLETLRSLTPEGAYAEVLAHLVMVNLVRLILWQANSNSYFNGSFIAGLDAIRLANQQLRMAPERQTKILETMLQMMLAQPVDARPGRSEPRMTRPRRRPYPIFKEPRITWRNQRKVG